LICLEAISTVPITSTFNQCSGSLDLFLYQDTIAEEQTYPNDGKYKVDFGAEDSGMLKDGVVGRDRFLLAQSFSFRTSIR